MSAKTYLGIALIGLMILALMPIGQTPLNIPAAAATDYTNSFPNFWRGPHFQELYITTYADPNAEFTAIQGGSPNAMDWYLTPTQITTLASNPRYNVNSSADLGVVEVVFSNGRFPSNVTSYRQTIAQMIDKQDIVNTQLPGVGGVMDDQLNPGYASAWRNLSYPWSKNIPSALATLAAGGWHYGYWATAGTAGLGDTLSTFSCPVDPVGVGVGNPGHNVLSCWKYDGTEFGSAMHDWTLNWTTTAFYARQDDPVRDYIGTQIALTAGANKAAGLDRLFTVFHVSSFISSRTAYSAPDCPGGGYESNACVGSDPAFSMYTQGLIGGTPDPSGIFFFYFNQAYLDVAGLNFGHWNNATMFSYLNKYFYSTDQSCTSTPCEGAVYSYERAMNGLITYLAYWDPMYYQKDFVPSTERVAGTLSGQNSGVPNGVFYETNAFSYYAAHLKGRTYGGSFTVGDYSPIHDLNPFDVATGNWVYNFLLLNRIYDSMITYDPSTGGYYPDMALNMSVSTLTNPILPAGFGPGYYHPIASAPYWSDYSGAYSHIGVDGMKITFNVFPNATWHDGSSVTDNDLLWNIRTDAMDVAGNTQGGAFPNLAYANITAPHQLTLWFNQTSYDWTLLASGVAMIPPTPWINLYTAQKGPWASGTGIVSDLSVNSRADLNLTVAGNPNPQNTLEGSSAYVFDVPYCIANPTTCFSAANAVGDQFAFKANDNWWLRDTSKATYNTGIVLMSPYLSPTTQITGSMSLKVAITNGANTRGLTWDGTHHDWVNDPLTTSDNNAATVQACVIQPGHEYTDMACIGTPVTLGFASGYYTGPLTVPSAPGVYHIKITATSTGSVPTTYGPSGTTKVSTAVGQDGVDYTWEGDAYHTAFTTGTTTTPSVTTPISPLQLLLGLLSGLLVVPAVRRLKRIPA